MESVKALRGQVVAVPIKEMAQERMGKIKGALKRVGILRSSETAYGQMSGDDPITDGSANASARLDADGHDRIKEGPTYESDESCRGRCLHYACCRCSKRYYTAWLSSLGFMITFGIRCNMSWAMLSMITRHNQSLHRLEQQSHHSAHLNASQSIEHGSGHMGSGGGGHHGGGSDKLVDFVGLLNVTTEPDFYWTAGQRGFVDSSFFYGYLVTQIPGGVIAAKFPANKLFGIAVGGSALLNMFLPTACRMHFGVVMAIRVMQGLIEGTSYPACHGIWRYWAPPLERSRLATIAFCGSYAGAVLGLSVSGLMAQQMGWQSPFYVYGILGFLWFIWWWRVTYERPSCHPTITETERNYIETSIGDSPNIVESKIPIPWGKFFLSMPVYAIIVANFARSWSFYLLITKSPKYFREVFGYDLAETGILSALPHLVMAIIVPLGGQLADRLRKNTLSTTNVRKIFNCGGFGMEAVFLLGVGYSKTITSAMVCMVLAVGFSGFAISGYNVNHLDIAPRYASILMGISNGVGTISGMICPLSTELITRGGRKEGWVMVFLTASLVHFAGVAFYAVFASGEKQPWAEAPEEALSNWQPPTDLPPDGPPAAPPTTGYSTTGRSEPIGQDWTRPNTDTQLQAGYGRDTYQSTDQQQTPYGTRGYEQSEDQQTTTINRSSRPGDGYHQNY